MNQYGSKRIIMDQNQSKWIFMDQNKLKLNTCHDHFRHQPPDQRVIYSFGISPSGGEMTPKRGDTGMIPARVPPPLLLQHPHCLPFLVGNHNLQLRSPIFLGPVKKNTKWIMFWIRLFHGHCL